MYSASAHDHAAPAEGRMKEQYVGDINDYRKYALLRHFAVEGDLRIGVCWMLTPPDNGNLRSYLNQPATWRDYDSDVFDHLQRVQADEAPSRLAAIEGGGIIPSALFF